MDLGISHKACIIPVSYSLKELRYLALYTSSNPERKQVQLACR
jgi:hypothetical protein